MRVRPIHRVLPAVLLAVLLMTTSTLTEGGASSSWQPEEVRIDNLFSTPPLSALPPGTSVSLLRLTLLPGATRDVDAPGPIICFVESGSLAIRESRSGGSQILLYSGPAESPPLGSDKRDSVLPAGHAVLVEDGALGPIRNPGGEPTIVLAVQLVPEQPDQGQSVVDQATSVP